jgi:hypothetical protein
MLRAYSIWVALLSSSIGVIAVAQTPPAPDRVQWTAAFASTGAGVASGSSVVLEISGAIQDGWHVYALTEPSGGPTALRVTLDANEVAQAAGSPSGTAPRKHRDPSFGFETQFYTHSFTVRLPVVLKSTTGRQLVPVSVRFQTCSDRECQPPTTAHLAVPVDVQPGAS